MGEWLNEEYTLLDINQSPFNVGTPIELPEFNLEQVKNLATGYGLDWDTPQVEELMNMVGGHPYLLQEALKYLQQWNITLENLLKTLPTEAGIYGNLLQEHLWNLQQNRQKNPELDRALAKVVEAKDPVRLESALVSKLDELGLVKRQDNGVEPRCNLYRLYFQVYFQERLKDNQ